MFGSKSKSDAANSSGISQSGLGAFTPSNRIYINKPFLDVTNPIEILSFCGLVLVGWYAWRKFK
jgi:hypothetical protein